MNKPLTLKKKGSVIVLVLIAVVLLLVIGGGLLGIGLQSSLFSVKTTSKIQARCAVDAAVVEAVFEMNEKLKTVPWDDSLLPEATNKNLPNSEATYSYTVTGDTANGYSVNAVGMSGSSTQRVTAGLRLEGPFGMAIFSDDGIILENSASIDWFNYSLDEKILQVGTNSTDAGAVLLNLAAIINGDVVVGADGDPDVVINDLLGTITGDTYSLTEVYEMSMVEVPESLELLPSGGILNDNTTIVGSGKYDEISLTNNKVVTIDGPVSLYVVGNMTVDNSGELQIVDAGSNPDACLTVYLGGDIQVVNSGLVNNLTADAKKLKIYCLDSCENITLSNSVDFYGTIYAPTADVVIDNSTNVYGAIVADSFVQNNSANLNYDASLRDVDITDWGVRFVVEDWEEE
jgi:hypothetical protein